MRDTSYRIRRDYIMRDNIWDYNRDKKYHN